MTATTENRWNEWAAKMDESQVKQEKRRIMKNIFIISLGFLFNFTAFQV